MSAGRVLVIDDDPQLRRTMRVALTTHGYEVDDAKRGDEGLGKLGRERFDLVLLDIRMPEMSGIETCRAIRQCSDAPIIMLTAHDSDVEMIDALDAGADDYVVKPFKTPELLARMRAVLRRHPGSREPIGRLRIGDVDVDFDSRRVTRDGRSLHLTPREFDCLCYLIKNANRVIRHREILQAVWGPDQGSNVEVLRVVVNQLRKKIESDPSQPAHLLTEPWVGYRMALSPAAA